MNSKRANWLYMTIILVDLAVIALLTLAYYYSKGTVDIGIVLNLVISQLMLIVPTLIFALCSKSDLNEMLGYHKMKISSALMVVLYTFLCMPLMTAINAISMLFVDNAVNSISGEVLQIPFPIMLFLMGMFGPFCEEFVFRGMIFRGYKKSGSVFWSVILSSLLFGLMHMNFNQAAYAFAIGIMFALLVEATGSLWGSTIAHMVVNMEQVCLMFLVEKLEPGTYTSGQVDDMLTQDMLIMAIGPYLLVAIVCTALAICVLAWIAKNEDRAEHLGSIWAKRKEKKERMITIPLIIGIVLGVGYMIFELVWTAIFY
ncbi:MAG: CPBP family intramembrane metalloprotease [Lachnospiraceae bacterium]|nr:CPBP family intramembrane metalloprotease [Lachnospiraceae bacterium]